MIINVDNLQKTFPKAFKKALTSKGVFQGKHFLEHPEVKKWLDKQGFSRTKPITFAYYIGDLNWRFEQ